MEQQGILKTWDDQKGFGFIEGEQGRIFVHISAMRGESRPVAGAKVYYLASKDEKGRWRASHMRDTALSIDRPKIRRKPKQYQQTVKAKQVKRKNNTQGKDAAWKTAVFILCVCITGYGLFELFMKKFWIWPIVFYVVASFTSFIQYWLDKEKAQSDSRRIAELDLHSVELLGGWPGAFIAQKAFRHKTRKESYQSTYWLIVFLHLAFWIDTLFLGQHALTFIGFNY